MFDGMSAMILAARYSLGKVRHHLTLNSRNERSLASHVLFNCMAVNRLMVPFNQF
jgi:hypothetical protein